MFDELMQKRSNLFLNAYFDRTTHMPAPQGLEREYMPGIHREPVAGAIQKQGNIRVPQAYIFEKGKRVSTGRTHRFAAR